MELISHHTGLPSAFIPHPDASGLPSVKFSPPAGPAATSSILSVHFWFPDLSWVCRAAFVFKKLRNTCTNMISKKQLFSLLGFEAQSSKLGGHSGERLGVEMWKQIAPICCPEPRVNCCHLGRTEGNVGYRSPQLTPALGRKLSARSRDYLSIK